MGKMDAAKTSILDSLDSLARGAAQLYLSVEAPDRVRGWDAVLVTAASAQQAELYRYQLDEVRRKGLLGPQTLTLAVEDPDGCRIGSGGATLNALRALHQICPDRDLVTMRILMVHAGGDSRRVPWANVAGKSFIPFPLFADPDRSVPTLFDHQLAVTAPAAHLLSGGGMVSLAGDVLPLFSFSQVALHANGATVLSTPAPLDVAERHGVFVPDSNMRVLRLLQKQSAPALAAAGALVEGGAALLDTGIFAFRGDAFRRLVAFATQPGNPVARLLKQNEECSLYEEIAAAMVPGERAWLRDRPLGTELETAFEGVDLYTSRVERMTFVHFGTTGEVLSHLAGMWQGRLRRRVLSECGPGVAASAVVSMSHLGHRVAVGEGSAVHGCDLTGSVVIGSRCILLGVRNEGHAFRLPGNLCLWQVPVRSGASGDSTVILCCGADDNPKNDYRQGTFCGQRLDQWMTRHGIQAGDLWEDGESRCLWNARLFARTDTAEGLQLCHWLVSGSRRSRWLERWRQLPRYHLGQVHADVAMDRLAGSHTALRDRLILDALTRTVTAVSERNALALGQQLSPSARKGTTYAMLLAKATACRVPRDVVHSRFRQIGSDFLLISGRSGDAANYAQQALAAVQREVAGSVQVFSPPKTKGLVAGCAECVELPVRFDIAGGWSDTPPYCLERPGRVLNMAVMLETRCPVGAAVETLADPVWQLELADCGASLTLHDGEALRSSNGLNDAFTLLRTALLVAGYGHGNRITQGVRVRTWAHVPKGSGLGTSSILAAALLKALERLAGRADDTARISDLVLLLEQQMTTGGGWQDQVGGLVGGVKCITSLPVHPLALTVEPVPLLPEIQAELEARLVIVFTGIERLAKNVLQIVVERYLRRDRHATEAIGRLVWLADEGRRCLALGDFNGLGRVMNEAWQTHQELDPHCSNCEVDQLLHSLSDLTSGAKLAGAGGGGFAGLLAKDKEAAARIRERLEGYGHGIRCYPWRLWQGDGV